MTHHYALFSALYRPHTGGVEVFTENLAHELAQEGHHVTVVTSQVDKSLSWQTQDDGVVVAHLPSRNLLNGRLPRARRNGHFKAMMDGLARTHYDGILVNTRYYDLCLDGVRLGHASKVPTVLLDHSSAAIGFGIPGLDSLVHLYEKSRTKTITRYDPQFYGVSQLSVEWLLSMGISACGVIHNAIDSEAFRNLASTRNFRAELGIPPEAQLVSFVGRLVKGKGADVLLNVAKNMEMHNSTAHFVLAGDGPQQRKLEAEAPKTFHVLGRLGKPDVSALFSQSDVYCFPSSYPEGLPTTLLEAASWGVPTVATNVGGTKEVLPNDTCGIVLEKADNGDFQNAIETLLLNPEQAQRMGMAARLNVEQNFSWRQTASALIEAWQEPQRD